MYILIPASNNWSLHLLHYNYYYYFTCIDIDILRKAPKDRDVLAQRVYELSIGGETTGGYTEQKVALRL